MIFLYAYLLDNDKAEMGRHAEGHASDHLIKRLNGLSYAWDLNIDREITFFDLENLMKTMDQETFGSTHSTTTIALSDNLEGSYFDEILPGIIITLKNPKDLEHICDFLDKKELRECVTFAKEYNGKDLRESNQKIVHR